LNDTRTTRRSRALLTMRKHDENVARRSQAETLCDLQAAESRIAVLTNTLGQYDQAARDELQTGAAGGLFARYARATGDIRRELARLEDERRHAATALLQCEGVLLEAHRARKSADEYHRRVVRMIAAKRTAELDNQATAAGSSWSVEPYDSQEQSNVY
jgi:hypothetical protein